MFRYKIQDLQVSNSQKKSSTSTILIVLLVAGSLIAVLTIALSCGKKDLNNKEKYVPWDLRRNKDKEIQEEIRRQQKPEEEQEEEQEQGMGFGAATITS